MRVPTRRATEARRQNGAKSPGPRSAAGRRRVAGNARRHGLTAPLDDPDGILNRYRALTGKPNATLPLEGPDALSRAALDLARAEAELARVRSVLALIDREIETQIGALYPPEGLEPPGTPGAPSVALLLALEQLERRGRLMRYLRAAERAQERARRRYACALRWS